MSFSKNTSKYRLEGTTLYAECLLADGKTTKPSTLNLDTILGNEDGQFKWASKDFSKSIVEKTIELKGTILSAKLKTKGSPVDATVNLDERIASENGVLKLVEAAAPKPQEPSKPVTAPPAPLLAPTVVDTTVAGTLTRESSSSSTSSTSSTSTAVSTFSQTQQSSTVTQSSTKTTYIQTMTLDISKSCKVETFKLVGGILTAECLLADGTYRAASIDLDQYIGNIDGNLRWYERNFTQSSQEIRLEGTILRARCRREKGVDVYAETSINLAERLRNSNGSLILIAYDSKLAVTLSTAPWMKFKVIAEPDFSVIASHPVIQSTLVQIADSTVQHVTTQFSELMAIALAATIKAVQISAQEHIRQSMIVLTQNLSAEAAHAHLHTTYTASGFLKSDQEECGCKVFHCSCPTKQSATVSKGLDKVALDLKSPLGIKA